MQTDAAETLALRALAWAAADGRALAAFLAASGLTIKGLREKAGEPELLAAFLDFVLAGDRTLEAMCAEAEFDAADLHEARRALPGRAPD
jgi:hypothetical protein